MRRLGRFFGLTERSHSGTLVPPRKAWILVQKRAEIELKCGLFGLGFGLGHNPDSSAESGYVPRISVMSPSSCPAPGRLSMAVSAQVSSAAGFYLP
jgi:hypothetical protein